MSRAMGGVPTSALRRFGLGVGGVFLALAAVSRWRGHVVAPALLAAAGALLVVPGVVAPRVLRPVQRVWMRGAAALGDVNARILLTVVYCLIVTPIGLVLRRVRDPLDRRLDDGRASQWVKRAQEPVDPGRYERQF